MKKLLLTIVGIILLLGSVSTFHFLGHSNASSMYDAGVLAEKFAKEGRPASDCFKIHTFIPTYPPLGMIQSGCIRDYAKLKRDPEACALLLPNESALSCIGAATNFPQQECISSREGQVSCETGKYTNPLDYPILPLEDCEKFAKYKDHRVVHWCFGERARLHGELEECLKDASKPLETDDCYYQRSMKKDDLRLDLCEKIVSNELMRKECVATVKAYIKYPELIPQ